MYFADIALTSFEWWFGLCSVCTIKYIARAVEMSSAEGYPQNRGLVIRPNALTLALESRAYTALRAFADRRSPKPAHLLTGERGEDAAYFHLRRLGYTVVGRRWRTERLAGDLDLVAWDGPTLVIFEVKTRTAASREGAFAPAETAVDPHKQHTLLKMASAYLRQFPAPARSSIAVRFDILSVYQLPTGIEVEHFQDAFHASEPAVSRRR
jgi:putative endonuclease